jgi:hypothetical protein
MKKHLFIGLLVTASAVTMAQTAFSVTEGAPAYVYSLPATELVFELEVEKTVEKPGVFFQYSQRYLATSQVVTAESTNYSLKSVRMSTRSVADISRTFSVSPAEVSGLVVDANGLLAGVNVEVPRKGLVREHQRAPQRSVSLRARPEGMLPLNQEYMMAGSTAKLAEGAAYQIYRLRESRINLLSGEVDAMPDGEALKQMLAGIDNQERELTELFVGSVRKSTERHRIVYRPDPAELETVLFRLSARRGIVANDDLGGEPYFVVFDPESIQVKPSADSKFKAVEPVLFTVVPAPTSVEVSDGVTTLLKQQVDLPQFGVLIPYDARLLRSRTLVMEVDPSTGRLLRMQP